MEGWSHVLSPMLWHELVFKFLDTPHLLTARAVCRHFRARLNESRHWDFSLFYRMRCDERLLYWKGIELGMAREQRIRDNSLSGKYVECAMDSDEAMYYIGTRVMVQTRTTSTLYNYHDRNTALHTLYRGTHTPVIVAGRWWLYTASDSCSMRLFDCLNLVEVLSIKDYAACNHNCMEVSGHTFAFETSTHVVIMRFDPVTGTVRKLGRIVGGNLGFNFKLCDSGRHYLITSHTTPTTTTLYLVDCLTGLTVRTIATLESTRVTYLRVTAEKYVVVTISSPLESILRKDMVFKIDDNTVEYMLPCITTKLHAFRTNKQTLLVSSMAEYEIGMYSRHIIAIRTGEGHTNYTYSCLTVDYSGTMAYRSDGCNLICLNHVERMGQSAQIEGSLFIIDFKYGNLSFVSSGSLSKCKMISFDC